MAPQGNSGSVLDTIVGQSAQAVALLFQKYGIKAPVSKNNLLAALVLHKRKFSDDLFEKMKISYSDGTQEGKEKFASILNQAIGAATGIFSVLAPGKAKELGIEAPPAISPMPAQENPEPVKKILGIPAPAFIGIIVIIVLVIVLLLVKKKA